MIRAKLALGVSMRSCAYNLNLTRKTIERKFVYLGKKARMNQKKLLKVWAQNPLVDIQFDDLISSVHTKLKSISVSVVIDSKNFKILGVRSGVITAFGKIAEISRSAQTIIHNRYPEIIANYFPKAKHKTFKGLPASIAGLGELKTKGFDPLFAINHTQACFRGGVNRFFRKTWCTSKSLQHTQDHIDIFYRLL